MSNSVDAPATDDNALLRAFLSKVFQTMDEHYYLPVSNTIYEEFLANYPAARLKQFNQKSKQANNFMHLGAGLLVNKLKSPTDKFTNFLPSEKTKEFKATAYAVTEDLGLEGVKVATGFSIIKVQRYCQAYDEGVRSGDILTHINGSAVTQMDETAILKALSPPLGTIVRLVFITQTTSKVLEIQLESKSYFRETVTAIDSGLPGVLILKISHFNRKTSDNFSEQLSTYGVPQIKRLILDLRDNGGGPPLAAREILGFFLPQDDLLFAIARKKQRPVMLTAPAQPVSYKGLITILVNHETGSAAEMFSGILQTKKIAQLIGQKTAGATYLKSIYDFDDGSMVFMITSLTYFYDRRVFPSDGLTPDIILTEDQDNLKFALGQSQ